MTETPELTNRDLSISRVIDAPAHKLFAAWTQPELITQWFTPAPYTTPHAETDLRPGGSSLIVMRSPEGQLIENRGVYLEVVRDQKIVFTDAYTSAWIPSEKPFFTGTITFEDLGNNTTRYTARATHWTMEDRDAHEKMGFEPGWNAAADQLEALVKRI